MRTPWPHRILALALGTLLLLLPAAALRAQVPRLAEASPRGTGFRESARVHIGHSPIGLALGDLAADGRPDVVVVNDDRSMTLLFSDGRGGLVAQRDFDLGRDVVGIALGDLDHDRLLDVAVSAPGSGMVFTLLGDGVGGLDVGRTLQGPWSPGALALLAPSGGAPDLVVADLFFQGLVLARNGGDGSFEFANQFAGFVDPVSIAVGDVARDGFSDVAVADAASHAATVVTDLGQRGQRRRDQPLAGRPVAVALGDLDRDGRDDLVVATRSPGTLAVCRGAADGSLGPAHADAAGPGPVALVLGDLDGDGRLDVAVADRDEVSIGLWAGLGDGTLSRYGSVPTGAGPVALAIADLNGDGWPDLVCANHDEGTVQVLLNTSPPPSGSIRLIAPSPNPASTTSRITFALSTSVPVTLDIHDLACRLVRRIVSDEMMPAGPHVLIWDGRTDAGDLARSGVYLVRLRAGSAEATTRIVLGR